MATTTVLAGSLDVLGVALGAFRSLEGIDGARVAVVATAAAFTGSSEAVQLVQERLPGRLRAEPVWAINRRGAQDEDQARMLDEADLVIACDGSALHARSTWRETALGEALERATRLLALGETGGALFDVMVDPRGGAPTVGLGYRHGLVLARPAPKDQMDRTRVLLDEDQTLVELGDSGVLLGVDDDWRVVAGDVVASRAGSPVSL